jgi:hypothetical protein
VLQKNMTLDDEKVLWHVYTTAFGG